MTKIRFEDLPSTNTPINAENLNKLNNVIVSNEEPTTGEEVWIQKGKNLFNLNEFQTYNFYDKAGNLATSSTDLYCWNHLDSSIKKFVVSFSERRNEGYVRFVFFNNNTFILRTMVSENNTIIETPNEATKIIAITDIGPTNGFNNLQIEEGEVATSYEPYTPKKIHTKNDNGYEEFYNEEKREVYSTSEQRIGTWIDSKPLYRKTFKVNNATNGSVSVSNLNIDEIVSQKTLGTETAKKYGAVDGNFYYDGNYFVAMGYKDSIWYNSNCTFSKLYITIEYTKTTD